MTTSTRSFTVADVMASRPIVVHPDDPLIEAARLMEQHRVHGLPVVDTLDRLVGVVSQTDLLRARATEYLWANWPGLAVRHLMTTPALTVHASASLEVAAQRMERYRVHRLVVVNEQDEARPIGVVSTTDLVRTMVRGDEA